MGKTTAICLAAFAILLVQANAFANSWCIEKDINLYGKLDQHLVDPVWGDVACGVTAAVNSFVYLERRYPQIYDRKLTDIFAIVNGYFLIPHVY